MRQLRRISQNNGFSELERSISSISNMEFERSISNVPTNLTNSCRSLIHSSKKSKLLSKFRHFQNLLRRTTIYVLQSVICSIVLIILTIAICVGPAVYSFFYMTPKMVIDKSLNSFSIPNHPVSLSYDAYEAAKGDSQGNSYVSRRKKRDLHDIKDIDSEKFARKIIKKYYRRTKRGTQINCLTACQTRIKWRMQIVYKAIGDGDNENIFTEDRLNFIHSVEMAIINREKFTEFCYRVFKEYPLAKDYNDCSPVNSLMTYFYPSRSTDGNIFYDGFGNVLQNINQTLKFALTNAGIYWYVDEDFTSANKRSSLLRSEVLFGTPLSGDRDEEEKRAKDYIISFIDFLKDRSNKRVRILYGGNEIFDYEVEHTFWNDIKLAAFSLGFIVLFMFILTSFSTFLTFWGIFSILLSFPLAIFFYRVVFKSYHLGILNGAAAFVIIGIGVDDVFVFVNTFRQSIISNHGERLFYTLNIAGKATFFTSFTTSAAFAANVASSIPAIHDFGLFMSLIVSCCWFTVVFIMTPAINIWSKAFSKCENYCYKPCNNKKLLQPITLPVNPEDNFVYNNGDAITENAYGRQDDRDMQSEHIDDKHTDPNQRGLEMNNGNKNLARSEFEGGWPLYLGMLNLMLAANNSNENNANSSKQGENICSNTITSNNSFEGCGFTRILQSFIYNHISRYVIKWKWVIFALYIILLVISGGIMSQLKAAKKPPQMFSSDSNLQMLTDLTLKISHSDIKCEKCSGFYKANTNKVTQPSITGQNTTEPTTITTIQNNITTIKNSAETSIFTSRDTTKITTELTSTSQISLSTSSATLSSKSVISSKITNSQPSQTATFTTTKSLTDTSDTNTPSKNSATQKTIPDTTKSLVTTSKFLVTTTQFTPSTTNTFTSTLLTPKTFLTTVKPQVIPSSNPDPPSQNTRPQGTIRNPATATGKGPTDYDPCANNACGPPKEKPTKDTGATVYVLFGIDTINRENVSYKHVLNDKGKVIYDMKFQNAFRLNRNFDRTLIKELCTVCKYIASQTDLVVEGGAQCFLSDDQLSRFGNIFSNLGLLMETYDECKDLPRNYLVNGGYVSDRSRVAIDFANTGILWLSFAFSSTTHKGKAYYSAYSSYIKWEKLIAKIKKEIIREDSPLQGIKQTSEFWVLVMMETIAVSSAIYGLILSMVICIAAVTIFTGHILLLIIVILTIIGVICLVVAIFYLASWEMGAVEALSLSILVGSSVDYCVHIVEGYLLSSAPAILTKNKDIREMRTRGALGHIGLSIFSSAITTIAASLPLTQAIILPFSKFGQIVAINSTISIIYAATACPAFLAIFGPAKFKSSWKALIISVISSATFIGVLFLALYVATRLGVDLPSPSGKNLFQ